MIFAGVSILASLVVLLVVSFTLSRVKPSEPDPPPEPRPAPTFVYYTPPRDLEAEAWHAENRRQQDELVQKATERALAERQAQWREQARQTAERRQQLRDDLRELARDAEIQRARERRGY